MKFLVDKHTLGRLIILCVVLFALAALSTARTPTTTSVNIVNNSSRTVLNIYLSHVNVDDWGDNQLGSAAIAPGGDECNPTDNH